MHVRDRRATAYNKTLELMLKARGQAADEIAIESREAAIWTGLWGSRQVRDLFQAWLKAYPTGFGPDSTDADRARVVAAANAVREQMAAELQGWADPT